MPDQFTLFTEAAALGLLLGANYDIFRALRACYQIKKITLVFVTDSLFWLTATIYCLWYIFYCRWGEIYPFTYFGLAVGAAVYFCWLSPCLFKIWHKLFSGVIQAGAFSRGILKRVLAIVSFSTDRISTGMGTKLKVVKNLSSVRRVFHHIYRNKK